MYFKCGAETSYTIKAINMESFEEGTEIWLEDNGQWYSLNENPEYTFNCVPGEYTNRFILHFMGPTGLDDLTKDDGNVKIYSWQQDAYIMNRGSETMDEYIAYDMMGRELHRGTLANSTINKVKIDDVTGYYIIKVITKEGGVYTGKVYITK